MSISDLLLLTRGVRELWANIILKRLIGMKKVKFGLGEVRKGPSQSSCTTVARVHSDKDLQDGPGKGDQTTEQTPKARGQPLQKHEFRGGIPTFFWGCAIVD